MGQVELSNLHSSVDTDAAMLNELQAVTILSL